MKDSKLLFLYSQSPRSGHNFIAEVIRCIVECETPLGLRSELPIAPILQAYKISRDSNYKTKDSNLFFDALFISDLRSKLINDKSFCLLKYTSFIGAEDCFTFFPMDCHIVSFRDPRDSLFSLFKGMNLNNKDIKSKVKRFILPTGLYHFLYAKKYASKILKQFPKLDLFFVLRYEDLVLRKTDVLQELIHYLNSNKTIYEVNKLMDDINIINTSFFKEETNGSNIWDASKPTERFNPINRSKRFNFFQRLGINLGSYSLRKKMGYI